MTCPYVVDDGVLQTISNRQLAALMSAVLNTGRSFRFQASGFSMTPFIQDGDILTLLAVETKPIKIGEILAFINPANEKLMVHRIIRRKGAHYMLKGDACPQSDGWVGQEGILGRVSCLERLGHTLSFGLGPERSLIAALSSRGWLPTFVRAGWVISGPFLKRHIP